MKAQLAVTWTLSVSMCIAAASIVYAQPADQCLRMQIRATGAPTMWNRKPDAEKSTIDAWTEQTAKQAGVPYSQWAKARAKSITCDLASKSTIRCTAKGTPCK